MSGWGDGEIRAWLTGNWRPQKPPTAQEFIAHCLITIKETGKRQPFVLWDAQAAALEELLAHDFVISVKGRQVGITWLALALMLYEGTFSDNRAFPIARQSEEYAQDAVKRLLTLAGYDHVSEGADLAVLDESPMPERWRARFVVRNVKQLVAVNGSSWTAHTATQSLGRGLIGYRGLADEFAYWPWPARQRKAMESGCARLDIVSTGNGEGDDFHETWRLAAEGKGKYHPLFISAEADPRRDAEWFRKNVAEDADPDGAAREYARTPEDAFRAPEGVYFKRFTRERNVAAVEVTRSWQTFRCVDFGYRHPACLWTQVSPSGQLFVAAEHLPTDVTTPEFAAGILAVDAGMGLDAPPRVTYCDPAGKAANVQTAESEFEVFEACGLAPSGQSSGIRDGCMRLMNALADEALPLVVSDACPQLIAALSQVKPHRARPECYDFDHVIYSHPLDALRYGLVGWDRATGSADISTNLRGARPGGW